jgi:orotate phosphoribosyltransferase
MTRDEVLDLFRRSGALLEGHFRLTSGLHSPGYLQSPRAVVSGLGGAIGSALPIASAASARSCFLRRSAASSSGTKWRVLSASARCLRAAGRRPHAPPRPLSRDRVLVVEDVLTTGGSTKETMDVARAAGAQVVGAASIVNRSGGPMKFVEFDVPVESLLDYSLPTYEPEKCPLCAQGLPVVKPGSRQVAV